MTITLLVITIWIFSTCLHEFGHAITAYMAGDKTVKDKGYLTLNPMVYFHSTTTLVIPLFVLLIGGIPLPGAAVYINHNKIKSRLWLSLVSFAGPLFTFFVLCLLAVAINILPAFKEALAGTDSFVTIYSTIAFLIYLHIFVFILNLLPLPPLDGYGIIEPWLPKNVQRKIREHSNLGFALLFVLFFVVKDFARFMSFLSANLTVLLGADWKAVQYANVEFEQSSMYLVGALVVAWIIKGRFQSPTEKGDALMKKQNYAEALEQYKLAKEKSSQDTRIDLCIATCLLSLGRSNEAYLYLDNILKVEPGDVKAIGLKAACLSEEGRYQEASLLLEGIEEKQEENIEELAFPYVVKASSQLELGNPELALDAVEKALLIEPQDPNSLQLKAHCLSALGRYDKALVVLDAMARTKQGLQRACLLKGLLLISIDRKDEGLAEIKKILSPKIEDRDDDIRNLKKIFGERAEELLKEGKETEAQRLKDAAREIASGEALS